MPLITTVLPPNFCHNVTFTRHFRTEGQKISEAKGSLHGDYQQIWHLLSEFMQENQNQIPFTQSQTDSAQFQAWLTCTFII